MRYERCHLERGGKERSDYSVVMWLLLYYISFSINQNI